MDAFHTDSQKTTDPGHTHMLKIHAVFRLMSYIRLETKACGNMALQLAVHVDSQKSSMYIYTAAPVGRLPPYQSSACSSAM